MERYLDLTGVGSTTHIEIAKRLVDEMTMEEKRILINYIKSTMKPPQQRPPVNHTVSFSFKWYENINIWKYKKILKDLFLLFNNELKVCRRELWNEKNQKRLI